MKSVDVMSSMAGRMVRGSLRGVTAGDFTDPHRARVIWFAAMGLVLLAVVLTVGTVWWWRSSREEHPALGPLEEMSSRSWLRGDYASRQARLERARPADAVRDERKALVEVDLDEVVHRAPESFDDLLAPHVADAEPPVEPEPPLEPAGPTE